MNSYKGCHDPPGSYASDHMSLKTKKLDQGKTEMFILEFEKE